MTPMEVEPMVRAVADNLTELASSTADPQLRTYIEDAGHLLELAVLRCQILTPKGER